MKNFTWTILHKWTIIMMSMSENTMELILYWSLVIYLTKSFDQFSNYFYISGKLKLNTEIAIISF